MAEETILIVEDDGILATHLQEMLDGLGYRVSKPAASGEEAIAAIGAHRPDLILMDINLGEGMDGITAAGEIRKIMDVPTIYLTGYTQGSMVQKAKITTPYGYLMKPVAKYELSAAIEMALYRHAQDRLLREREAALGESEEKYRSLAESIQDVIIRYDDRCRILYANPAALRLLGTTEREVLGKRLRECGIAGGPERHWEEKILEVFASGKESISRLEWRSGEEERYFDWRLTPEFAEGGSVRSVLGVARDITELKQAEDGLKNQVRFVTTLLETIPNPVFYKDTSGIYRGCNHALEEMLNRGKETIVGHSVYDVSSPEIAAKHAAMDRELFLKPGTQSYEHKISKSDGTDREVLFSKASFLDSAGNVAGIVGVVLDITERKKAEEALRRSEERLRLAMEATSDGLWDFDLPTGQVYWSPRCYAMLGYEPNEFPMSFAKWLELMHPDEREAAWKNVEEQVTRGDGSFVVEFRCAMKQGGWRWIMSRGKTVERDGEGRPLRMIGTHADIEDRKRAEEKLDEWRALMHYIIRHDPNAIAVFDDTLRYIFASERYLHDYQVREEDVIGKSHYDVFPGMPERWKLVHRRVLKGAVESGEDDGIERPDGRVDVVRWECWPWYTAEGDVGGMILYSKVITERKLAEQKLRESEARYRLLAENSTDVIWVMDLQGRFQYVSPSVFQLRGYTPEEVTRQPLEEVVCESSLQRIREDMARAIRQARGEQPVAVSLTEVEQPRKDGTTVWTEVSAKLIFDDNGNSVGIQGVSRDITERKRAESIRLEMERRLLHAQKLESLGVLAGGIAHDFNNLLMAMIGNLDMAMLDLSPLSSARSSIEQAVNAAKRAADLTRQMLAYSGKGRFITTCLNLSELVEENVHMLRSAVLKNVVLNLRLEKELPSILADAGQMQQIVMNLITNASEAIGGRPGVVVLSTGTSECDEEYLGASALEEKPAPGRFVWVEVEDTGCGMNVDTRQRLFDPFFSTKFPGRGLGMSAVLGIVRGHKGAIMVDSEPQRGTTIRVLFPEAAIEKGDARSKDDGGTLWAGEREKTASRETILVVDDEEMVRDLCRSMMKRLGYDTLAAVDGAEAVEVFREHADSISAVVLDLTMPRMDGIAAFDEMLRLRPDVKVIMSSGYSRQEAVEKFGNKGVAGFLEKPFHLAALSQELKRVLGKTA